MKIYRNNVAAILTVLFSLTCLGPIASAETELEKSDRFLQELGRTNLLTNYSADRTTHNKRPAASNSGVDSTQSSTNVQSLAQSTPANQPQRRVSAPPDTGTPAPAPTADQSTNRVNIDLSGPPSRGTNITATSYTEYVVKRRYHREKGGVVDYYIGVQQVAPGSDGSTYSEDDLVAWATRIADQLDREFKDKVFELEYGENPTPREREVPLKEFVPRAQKLGEEWIKKEGLEGSMVVTSFYFEAVSRPTATKGKEKNSARNNGPRFGK